MRQNIKNCTYYDRFSPHFSCGDISPCDRVSPHLSCGEIFHFTTCHGENFSTWPIFSPQTPSVVSVTNMRYVRNIMQVYLQTVRGFDDSDCVRSLNLVQIIVAAKLSSSLEDQSEGREGFWLNIGVLRIGRRRVSEVSLLLPTLVSNPPRSDSPLCTKCVLLKVKLRISTIFWDDK